MRLLLLAVFAGIVADQESWRSPKTPSRAWAVQVSGKACFSRRWTRPVASQSTRPIWR